LLEEGTRGNDIVLTIDIELQKAIENIIIKQLIATKKEPNTEYYNRSFVIISNPKTGEILAMAGKQIIMTGNSYQIYDYTPGITTSPVAAGSVVKGASHIVGYNTGALKIGEVRNDACIKIANTPIKCSWMYLGNLNDITALTQSSNTYQFNTAIRVGKGYYRYNQPLTINTEAFNIYRKVFAEFGLGTKTGIDLPIESLGYKGSNTLPGYLLDFSIGQYDTYTPIQLSQYIGTIANDGYRMQPYLLKGVFKATKEPLTSIIYETKPNVLNKVDTDNKYIDRIQIGFKTVLEPYGTGYYYINPMYYPAGKTGTSQSFIDTNNDSKIDTETITHNFVAYAPYNNPTVTFTIVSPDISHNNNGSMYQSGVNSRLAYQVSEKYFQFYK
jgi:cell division protein FtsI/penicillin-binding protein 2